MVAIIPLWWYNKRVYFQTKTMEAAMTIKDKTCCFTGHRDVPRDQIPVLTKKVTATIQTLAAQGIIYYGAGGALGFDTISATAVLRLQRIIPQIKLILVLPCLSQAQRWSRSDQEIYESIKLQANKVVYTSQEYTRDCMFKRNRHLVDHSGTCVCYLTKLQGGTAYTVDYAKQNGLKIINLAD